MTDIAIVGVSFKMPQGAIDEDGFWDILESKRNVMTEWPASRIDIDSFNPENGSGSNKVSKCRRDSSSQLGLTQNPAA